MTNKYKHDAVIRAWLDGKVVQVKELDGKWSDMPPVEGRISLPSFSEKYEYRIKPIPRFRNVYVNGVGRWKISREAANNAWYSGEYTLGDDYTALNRLCIQEDPQNGDKSVFHPA